jgi:hypothetical protein
VAFRVSTISHVRSDTVNLGTFCQLSERAYPNEMQATLIDRFLPFLFRFHAETTGNNSRMRLSSQLVPVDDRSLQ